MSTIGAAILYYICYVCTYISTIHSQGQKMHITQCIGGTMGVMLGRDYASFLLAVGHVKGRYRKGMERKNTINLCGFN